MIGEGRACTRFVVGLSVCRVFSLRSFRTACCCCTLYFTQWCPFPLIYLISSLPWWIIIVYRSTWLPPDCKCKKCPQLLSSQQNTCCLKLPCIASSDDVKRVLKCVEDKKDDDPEFEKKPAWKRRGSDVRNCKRRYVCYRNLADLLYEGQCHSLPRCIVDRIRSTFPDPNGIYTGWHCGMLSRFCITKIYHFTW